MADKPRLWSEKRLADFVIRGSWNLRSRAGRRRVAALMPVEGPEAQQTQNHVIFLENFSDDLRRKVPTGK